jgi:hypothetical protein
MKDFGVRNRVAQRDIAIGNHPGDDDVLIGLEEKGGHSPTVEEKVVDETELPDPNAQRGVQKVEATTLTWTNFQLYCAYAS